MQDPLRDEYERTGYVVLRGFLTGGPLDMLRAELDRYIQEVVPRLPPGDAFYEDRARPETLKQMNRLNADGYFHVLSLSGPFREVAERLLNEPATPHGVEWFNKPPATAHPTPAHQDNYYFCLRPSQVLTMWLALDEVDEENGCLRYVPGSHLRGIRKHGRTATLGFSQGIVDYGPDDFATEQPISAKPGDLLIHHGETIHRADANRSSVRHRRSLGLVYQGESARRDETAFEKYLASSKAHEQQLVGQR
jgi:phytanoyl-CoA hydroxylase